MSPGGNKSKSKDSVSHFRSAVDPELELQDSAFDQNPAPLGRKYQTSKFSEEFSSESSDEEELEEERPKQKREKKKFAATIREKGVGPNNRKLTSKEKKCLKKGSKKMEKMERREREREEKLGTKGEGEKEA